MKPPHGQIGDAGTSDPVRPIGPQATQQVFEEIERTALRSLSDKPFELRSVF
jgi:hypothetical protein